MSKTATQLNASRPLTLAGTEILAADAGSGTGGATTGQTGGTTTQAIANLYKGTRGSSIASAASIDLGAATGNSVHITGSTGPITSLGTAAAGVERHVIFDSTPTLTHNATSLILPGGANITAAAGDSARFVSEGSGNWKCLTYTKADGTPVVGATVADNAITNAKLADMANSTLKGRTTAGTGDPEDLTAAQAAAILQGDGLTGGLCGFRNIPQNSQSTAYTCVAADAGKHILHPSADTTARTFTIPANSSVAFPIGTAITFVNQASAGTVTIAITTDTLRLAGAGTTGSRTLAANGIATAIKLTSTEWIISGTGLT
jgi:hypothetical protein